MSRTVTRPSTLPTSVAAAVAKLIVYSPTVPPTGSVANAWLEPPALVISNPISPVALTPRFPTDVRTPPLGLTPGGTGLPPWIRSWSLLASMT